MATSRPDAPPTDRTRAGQADQVPKRRRIAFRVVATLVIFWLLALNIFGLAEIVFMWFPDETVAEMFGEDGSEIALHRAHFMAVGITAWALVLSMVVQLREPLTYER